MDEWLIAEATDSAGSNIHTVMNWVHAYRYAHLAGNRVALVAAERCLKWIVSKKGKATKDDCDFICNVFLTQEKAKEVQCV